MNDREWLYRVYVAYKVYVDRTKPNQQSVEHFVKFLYNEYGIVFPDNIKHEQKT